MKANYIFPKKTRSVVKINLFILASFLFFTFCSDLNAQVLIPYSGSNSIACGTNTTLCTHAGCGSTYSASANGYTVINSAANAVITISGSYYTESGYDYVRIYSGSGTGGTLLITYAGNSTFSYTGTAGQTLQSVLHPMGAYNIPVLMPVFPLVGLVFQI